MRLVISVGGRATRWREAIGIDVSCSIKSVGELWCNNRGPEVRGNHSIAVLVGKWGATFVYTGVWSGFGTGVLSLLLVMQCLSKC